MEMCKRKPPRMCWSGCSSLLVDDLKAAGLRPAALLPEVSGGRDLETGFIPVYL